MKPFKILALAAVAVALAPAFAMAASLDLGGTVNTGASAGTGTGVHLDTGVNVGASAGTGMSSATSGNSGSATSSSGSASGSAMTGANGMLTITAADASDDSAMQGASAVTSSANVATDADFAAYAKSQLRSDTTLKEVDADANSVAIKYAEQGRFLGVFPVTMTASAKVAADGTVTFSYPWYRFLTTTSTNDAALRTALSTQAGQAFDRKPSSASEGATSTVEAKDTLTASEKARILAGMRMVLANVLNTSTSASASGAASSSAGY